MYKNCILAAALLLSAATAAFAQTPPGPAPVSLVIVLDAGQNMGASLPKLIDAVRRGTALSKKDGAMAGKARLFTSLVGGVSNQILLVVEFPSLAAYAASEAAHAQSPDWQKLSADFGAAGLKVVSTTLESEVKF